MPLKWPSGGIHAFWRRSLSSIFELIKLTQEALNATSSVCLETNRVNGLFLFILSG